MNRPRTCALLAGLTLGLVIWPGCGKDSDRPKYREIEGTITSIDPDTDEVSMSFMPPKGTEPIILTGRLAPDAEIFIDGVTARLEDLRVDDRVRVTGHQEGKDADRQLVAHKVHVRRQNASFDGGTTQPATAAADTPAEPESDGNP
jgi:hypothetical protein